jgi:hypothetical protein
MSEKQQIETKVLKLRQVRRWQVVLDFAVRGLFWGTCAAALLMFAARLWILPVARFAVWRFTGDETLALGLALLTGFGFALAGSFRRISPLSVANDIDVRLGLHERVSSALALDPADVQTKPFVEAVVHDAAEIVGRLPLRQVYPWSLPSAWRRCAVAVLLALGLSFVPQLNWFTKATARAEAKLIQDKGQQVLELAKKVEQEAEKQKDPELKKLAKEIKRVGEKLNNQQLKKKEALKELQRLSDKLQTEAHNQAPAGQKELQDALADQLKMQASTKDLGDALKNGDMKSLLSQMNQLLKDLQAGKASDAELKQLQDMSKAIREALQSKAAQMPGAQELKNQLDQLDKAIKQAQDSREALKKEMQSFQQDLNKLTQNMQQNQMGQQAQQLRQQAQQMSQQIQQQGAISQQSMQQMAQGLKQTMQQAQQMQQSGQLSQGQSQQIQQQAQQALNHIEGQQGQQSQQGQQGQQGQGQQGQLGQANQQSQQSMQGAGNQMGQLGQQMGQSGMGAQLGQMIAQMKQQLAYGGQLESPGEASSGWGTGTSPYAVTPKEAPNTKIGGNKQEKGKDYGDRTPTQFESLYGATDYAHGFTSENQLHGKMDFTKTPQKIEEVRSAPETQEALQGFASVVGSYANDEESAVDQEQVPQEYQDLVKQYFNQLKKDSAKQPGDGKGK